MDSKVKVTLVASLLTLILATGVDRAFARPTGISVDAREPVVKSAVVSKTEEPPATAVTAEKPQEKKGFIARILARFVDEKVTAPAPKQVAVAKQETQQVSNAPQQTEPKSVSRAPASQPHFSESHGTPAAQARPEKIDPKAIGHVESPALPSSEGFVERMKTAFRNFVASDKEQKQALPKPERAPAKRAERGSADQQVKDFGDDSAESEPVSRKTGPSPASVAETKGFVQSVRQRIGQFIGFFKSERQKAEERAVQKAEEDRRIAELELKSRLEVRRAESEIAAKGDATQREQAEQMRALEQEAQKQAALAAQAEAEERRLVEAEQSAEVKRIRRLEAKVASVQFEPEISQALKKLDSQVGKYVRVTLAAEELEDDNFESLQENYVDQCNQAVVASVKSVRDGLKVTAGDIHLLRVRTALYSLANELTVADKVIGRTAWDDLQATAAAGETHDIKATLAAYVAYSRTITGNAEAKKKLEKFVKQLKERDPVTAAVLQNRGRSPASRRR